MGSVFPKLVPAPDSRDATFRSKFGGLPWGLSPHRWPYCRECGEQMSCVVQVAVYGHLDRAGPFVGRSDLSDRVLHVFTCERPTVCSFWEPHAGANAAFFLTFGELQVVGGGTVVPDGPVLPEVWIEDWVSQDDPVAGSAASVSDIARFPDHPDATRVPDVVKTALRTRLGGAPYWTGNGPMDAPQPPFQFLMQIDKYLPVPAAEGGHVDLANFCSDGTGFVFTDPDRATLPSLLLVNR